MTIAYSYDTASKQSGSQPYRSEYRSAQIHTASLHIVFRSNFGKLFFLATSVNTSSVPYHVINEYVLTNIFKTRLS